MFEVPNGHKLTIMPGVSGSYLLKRLGHDLGSFYGHYSHKYHRKDSIFLDVHVLNITISPSFDVMLICEFELSLLEVLLFLLTHYATSPPQIQVLMPTFTQFHQI